MGSYKCSKCTETMDSKCPSERSIFPGNSFVTMVKGTMLTKTKPFREGSKALCLEIEYGCADEGTKARDMLVDFVNIVRGFSEEEAAIFLCDHDWYLPEGVTCSLNGHKHDRR